MNRKTGNKRLNTNKDVMTPREPISKAEKSVVSWLRRNVPSKKTKFLNTHIVEYFIGSKAVDALVKDSPWSKEGSDPHFASREYATDYLDTLLKHKMFHRAKKVPVPEKPKKNKPSKTTEEPAKDQQQTQPSPNARADGKKKRKIGLDMHLDQIFLDSQDAYVWLYNPFPWYYWILGSLIVLGVIGVCLFPLWPNVMRLGVHYLSVAAAGFLALIIVLIILQYILFGVLYFLSKGKLKFWMLPNLTEDVGFFESFVPLYDYTYSGESKKKDKDSDDEESDDEEEEGEAQDDGNETKRKSGEEESDDSTSKKSSTGKDFEIVNKNDTDIEPDDN